MDRRTLWGMLAGAALASGAFAARDYATVGRGSEGTVAAAVRHQGLQRQVSDLVPADTSVQAFLQSETFARLMQDENARTLLQDPEIAKILVHPDAAKALANPALQSALEDPGFRAALQDARFGEAMNKGGDCDEWGCGMNSPVVDGAVIGL